MNYLPRSPRAHQKGEIASLLTVISMLVLGAGFILGLNSTRTAQTISSSSRAEGIKIEDKLDGWILSREDGQFISSGATCGANFDTQIDPNIKDIIITHPVTKKWPVGQDSFSLVKDAGLTDIVDIKFVKNYQILVRFNPSDPNKKTPHLDDLVVIYKVPSQADKTFVVDHTKLPPWIYSDDTEIFLVFYYTKTSNKYSYTSATSKSCKTTTTTPAPTVTPTPTVGMCYDACKTDNQCGNWNDPATGKEAKMICLKKNRTVNPIGPVKGTSFMGFTLNSGGNEESWAYESEALVREADNGGKTMKWVSGMRWSNSAGKSDDFKDTKGLPNKPEEIGNARIYWQIDPVPVELRKPYDITLEGLPSNYEIVSIFCTNTETPGNGIPDGCANFDRDNTNKKSATIKNITITKNASIKYGWNVQKKKLIPRLTASPVTPKPQENPKEPEANICPQIIGKVQSSVIDNFLVNRGDNPSWNPAQGFINLTLSNINKPYHLLNNPLVFKKSCEDPIIIIDPTQKPTDRPTQAPTTTQAPTVTPAPTTKPNPNGHDKCDPATGEECKCMPPSCTGRDCSTYKLACEKPDEPCPGGICRACEYNAIVFVEECKNINPVTGECMTIGGSSRFDAYPVQQPELVKKDPFWKMWAPQNNRQEVNPNRPADQKPAEPNRFTFIPATNPAYDFKKELMSLFPLFDWGRNNTEGIAISPRQASRQEITVKKVEDLYTPNLPGIKIASDAELRKAFPNPADQNVYIPNEQYNNMEDATVQLFFNKDLYRIVPGGKKIYSCTNDYANDVLDEINKNGTATPEKIDKYTKMKSGTGACNMTAFDANPQARDKIEGLTVGCGQRIVYGWTLQKCTFDYDYIFVVDTSSTMVQVDPNVGKRKIDAAVEQLGAFIDNIQASGTDSRVALINFNTALQIYKGDMNIGLSQDIRPEALSADGKHMGLQTRGGFLPIKTSADEIKAQLPRFTRFSERMEGGSAGGLIERGTCIECGLDLAATLAHTRSPEEKRIRPAIVIFMTDGIPNSYPGEPTSPDLIKLYPPQTRDGIKVTNPVPYGWKGVYDAADNLRRDGSTTKDQGNNTPLRIAGQDLDPFDTVKLITVGYGDSNFTEGDGQQFEKMLKGVASDKTKEANARWAYSSDIHENAPLKITDIFADIQKEVNSCSSMQLAYDISQRARDINKDGIVNTIDLFMIYENYQKSGEDLPYDIDRNGTVNSLDISLVLNSLGTVITSETPVAGQNEINQSNSPEFQSN